MADELDAPWWRFAPALTGTAQGRWTQTDPLGDTPGPAYGVALVSRLQVLQWAARRSPRRRSGSR